MAPILGYASMRELLGIEITNIIPAIKVGAF